MFEVIDSIPNRMPYNKEMQMMVNYINDALKTNNMNVIIFQRKEGIIVVPTDLYNENLERNKVGEKEISIKNILTCWQNIRKKDKCPVVTLSILPELNPQKQREKCQFKSVLDLEEKNIAKMIYDKYEELTLVNDMDT